MRLEQIRDAYYDYTAKASAGARTLAFAGIAIIWVFRGPAEDNHAVPDALLLPLGFFAACLLFDWLHYVTSAVIWAIYNHVRERREDAYDEMGLSDTDPKRDDAPPFWINWPGISLWGLKLLAVGPGYTLLLVFLLKQWA